MADKTMRQIADTLGVHKTRVYRYIKEQGIEPDYSRNGANYFGEEKCNSIISAISETLHETGETLHETGETLHETGETLHETLLETLVKQLEIKDAQLSEKDRQIELLTEALRIAQETQQELSSSLHTAQALHAGTMQERLGRFEDSDEPKHRKGFFGFLKKNK